MMNPIKAIRRLAAAQEGVTAIEFAVVAPVVVLLMFGIIEFSLIMLASNVMESATTISSRLGKTGFTTGGISRTQTIINSIQAHAGSLLNVNNLTVSSKYYAQYDQIGDPEPWNDANHNGIAETGEYTDVNGNGQYDADMATGGYGNANDVVVYTISYPWTIMTPIMSNFIGHNGVYTITTHAVVKNEPY